MGSAKIHGTTKVTDVLSNPHLQDFTAEPQRPPDGEFQHEGPVWWVGLDDKQTKALAAVIASGGGTIAIAAGPLWLPVAAAMTSASGYILTINKLGGENGVDINGVVGTQGVIVTPRGLGMLQMLIDAARLVVAGRTILDLVVAAASRSPGLAASPGIPGVASVFAAMAAGTPLGWALAGVVGLAVHLLGAEPDPDQHGGVHADRDAILEWESFWLQCSGDDRVAILSWQGFFSARAGGGSNVYANRPQANEWETWRMIDNHDGTVSFQTINGHYLVAEGGGGREYRANRTQIGDWEKFVIVRLNGGKIALKTHVGGTFVSVQKDL